MKVSAMISPDLSLSADAATRLEAVGYDECFSAEINNDPFLPLALAASGSQRLTLSTSIAVAFARNPMTLATTAWDLQQFSGGRFVLGLGSQIRPHITKRFGMPWSHPAPRMKDFIQALRAIWADWDEGNAELNYRGEFYQHTLMTPMFVPSRRDMPPPKVRLAAVGPHMTRVAGEVADGLIAHGFTTERYLREVTLPAVEAGLAASGRDRSAFDISCPLMVVSGEVEERFMANKQAVCAQLGFYGSTPAYRPVLELHGWGGLQEELNRLSKAGRWQTMGELIDDDILNTFAVVAERPQDLPALLKARIGGLVDVWQCGFEFGNADQQRSFVTELQP